MLSANLSPARFTTTFFSMVMIAAFGLTARAQGSSDLSKTPYMDDWTHHHMVFSNPGTKEDAVRKGKLANWLRVTSDTRYQIQQGKRSHSDRQVVADRGRGDDYYRDAHDDRHKGKGHGGTTAPGIVKDWSVPIGSSASASLVLTIGTPSASTISSSSTLTLDGITFDAGAPTPETATIVFSFTRPATASAVTIGSIVYTFSTATISSAPASGCTVYSATFGTGATSLYQAITNTGTQGGTNYMCASGYTANAAVTATHTGGSSTINLTGVTAGPTGFTLSTSGTTNLTTNSTAGTWGVTSGTANPPTFAYLTGATTYVSSATLATNLATAINANTTTSGDLSAAANGSSLTLTANAGSAGNSITAAVANFTAVAVPGTGTFSGGITATVQPNTAPAKWGASLTTADCTNDFVVYPTGQPGAAGGANIIAYNKMYTTGCSGTVPSVYWAYNTGTGTTVTTSPIISPDGTKVAFIQSNGTNASLVIVKWASAPADSLTSPETLGTSNNIATCSAPCMTVTSLSSDDTYSSPYYDLITDSIYVGDDSGSLEKFTGVFYGTAVTTIAPVALGHTYALASPVYDPTSGCVFVGDIQGYLYKANSGWAGTVCTSTTFSTKATSAILGNGSANAGIFDGVLLDSTAQTVYAFVTASAVINKTGTCASGNNCVVEFPTSFAAAASPSYVQPLGAGALNYNLYDGTFDNVYYSSTDGTGNLYSVGPNNINTAAGLLRIPVSTGGVLGAPVTAVSGLTTTSGSRTPWPSPVTEFCNGTCGSDGTKTTNGTDYVFFSVYRGAITGGPSNCTNSSGNGCIYSYNITTPAAPVLGGGHNYTAPPNPGCWATGAIVIDNSATLTGASQIYFVNLNGAAAGGPNGLTSSACTTGSGVTLYAIQATQSNP